MVDPSVLDGGLHDLTQCHDFLVHGVMRRRLAAPGHRLFKTSDAVSLDFARRDFGENQATEKRNEMTVGAGMLSTRICAAALTLRDDVEFAQILFGRFAERLPAFQFAAAQFSAQLKIPGLRKFLCFGEALLFGGCAAILAGEIAGALPACAVRTFLDVNLAAEDGVLFRRFG